MSQDEFIKEYNYDINKYEHCYWVINNHLDVYFEVANSFHIEIDKIYLVQCQGPYDGQFFDHLCMLVLEVYYWTKEKLSEKRVRTYWSIPLPVKPCKELFLALKKYKYPIVVHDEWLTYKG